MKNNFYSYWQREKKRYYNREGLPSDNMNYHGNSDFKHYNKDFDNRNVPENRPQLNQNYQRDRYTDMHYGNRQQDQ